MLIELRKAATDEDALGTCRAPLDVGHEVCAAALGAAVTCPRGAFLMTGTGIVPPDAFTLRRGDVVTIGIEPIGTIENRVA